MWHSVRPKWLTYLMLLVNLLKRIYLDKKIFPIRLPPIPKIQTTQKMKKSNPKSSPITKKIKTKTIKKPLTSSSPSLINKTRATISDLKKTTSLHIDSIKRNIDCCYSDLLKDMDASHTRLQKRFKAQSQACEQSMVEAEKDFKKMIDHMSETHDTMEAPYMDVIAEAQARATRLCKTTIPELKQSVEKAIDTLRTHYVAAST